MNDFRRLEMPRAFVLINVATGSEDIALKQLKNIGIVKEAFVSLTGYTTLLYGLEPILWKS
jgi:hypothetical protein